MVLTPEEIYWAYLAGFWMAIAILAVSFAISQQKEK